MDWFLFCKDVVHYGSTKILIWDLSCVNSTNPSSTIFSNLIFLVTNFSAEVALFHQFQNFREDVTVGNNSFERFFLDGKFIWIDAGFRVPR